MTAVVIASGPSLTAEDVAAARGHCTIVVNTTFVAAPWADHLYACDTLWWAAYIGQVKQRFGGRLWTISETSAKLYGLNLLGNAGRKGGLCTTPGTVYGGCNGGHQAIGLAHELGYRRILLLGFDCQTGPYGETHHHGDHPGKLNRDQAFDRWIACFGEMAKDAQIQGVEIINCSRATALTCFPRATIQEVLHDKQTANHC